jgi:hypothetical protein
MMQPLRRRKWLVGALLLLVTSCQKLNYEQTLKLEPGDFQTLAIDAPRSAQQVTVNVQATGSAVEAFVVLEKDRAAAEQALRNDKKPLNPLAQAQGEDIHLSVAIPAKTAFCVLVSGARKSTQVKISVTGR